MKKIVILIFVSITVFSCVKEKSWDIKNQLVNKSLSITRIEGYVNNILVYKNESPKVGEIIKEYTEIGGFDANGGIVYVSYFDSLIVFENDNCASFVYSKNGSKTYPPNVKNINLLSNSEVEKVYSKKNKLETVYNRQYIDESIVNSFLKCK